MSGKLDQSLDDIVSSHRRGAPRGGRAGARGRPRGPRQATKSTPAPVGGIKKSTRSAKGGVPSGPLLGVGESKIQVSNMPKDVSESQIKEYFTKSIGPIKRVDISYGPGGISRGVATVTFIRNDGATKAVDTLEGVYIDGKAIKIDVILDARRAAALPPPKALSERITQKAQPKSAANPKPVGAAGARGAKGKRGGRGGRNATPRVAKKTAEELDSEMVDYWNTGAASTEVAATGGAAPAANGDAPMEDEIL